MSGQIADLLLELSAVFCTGMAIKMMDDFLDREIDALQAKQTFAQTLGQALVPYALLFLAIGISLKPVLSGSLFFASYALGMGKDTRIILPSRLPAWGEIFLTLFGGLLLYDFFDLFSSCFIILFIQLLDDFYDYYFEKDKHDKNLLLRYGKVECSCLILIVLLLCLLLDFKKLFLVIAVTPLVICLSEKRKESDKMAASFFLLLVLITFLIGYCLGKAEGKRIGFEQTIAYAPIALRQQSLEVGYCLLCAKEEPSSSSSSTLL